MATVTIPNSPIHSESKISQIYGRHNPNISYTCGYHTGIDFVPSGETENNPYLYPCFDGEVVSINTNTSNALGVHCVIKDNKSRFWRYCHMISGSLTVNVGDHVTTNTILGRMGATGNVTGRHLHLECQNQQAWKCGTFLNPASQLGIPNVVGTIIEYDGTSPMPSAEWIYKNAYLNETEKQNNAICVINYLRTKGINDKTIAGILGNIEAESTIEPHLTERGGGGGYGLVQWTPQSVLINHCSTLNISPYTDGNIQLECIIKEVLGTPASINEWYSTQAFISNYYDSGATSDMIGITGQQFINNDMGWEADKLAILFMSAYERPALNPLTNHYTQRMSNALKWYNFMGGILPPSPDTPTSRQNLKKWFMYRKNAKIRVKGGILKNG